MKTDLEEALGVLQRLSLVACVVIFAWLISYAPYLEKLKDTSFAENFDIWLGLKEVARSLELTTAIEKNCADFGKSEDPTCAIDGLRLQRTYPQITSCPITLRLLKPTLNSTYQIFRVEGKCIDPGPIRFPFLYFLRLEQGEKNWKVVPAPKAFNRDAYDEPYQKEWIEWHLPAPDSQHNPDLTCFTQRTPGVRALFKEVATSENEKFEVLDVSVDPKSSILAINFFLSGIALWMIPSLVVLIETNQKRNQISTLYVFAKESRPGSSGFLLEMLLRMLSAIFVVTPIVIFTMQWHLLQLVGGSAIVLVLVLLSGLASLFTTVTFGRLTVELGRYRLATPVHSTDVSRRNGGSE